MLKALCNGPQCTMAAIASCPRCQAASYCSAFCQQRAWSAHALHCALAPPMQLDVTVDGAPGEPLRFTFTAHTTVGGLAAAVRARAALSAPVLRVLEEGAGGRCVLLADGDALRCALQPRADGQLPRVRIAAALAPLAAPAPAHAPPLAAAAAPPPPLAAAARPPPPIAAAPPQVPDRSYSIRLTLKDCSLVQEDARFPPVCIKTKTTTHFSRIFAAYPTTRQRPSSSGFATTASSCLAQRPLSCTACRCVEGWGGRGGKAGPTRLTHSHPRPRTPDIAPTI